MMHGRSVNKILYTLDVFLIGIYEDSLRGCLTLYVNATVERLSATFPLPSVNLVHAPYIPRVSNNQICSPSGDLVGSCRQR